MLNRTRLYLVGAAMLLVASAVTPKPVAAQEEQGLLCVTLCLAAGTACVYLSPPDLTEHCYYATSECLNACP